MADKKYVFMRRDELGDEVRAHGTDFLADVHSFPAFDEEDEAMFSAFCAWKDALEERGQREWEEHFGPESRIFLEEEYSSKFNNMGLSDLEIYGLMF